nr:hypothetical protein Iba_chr12cCG13820 [Ipomoea batatas]
MTAKQIWNHRTTANIRRNHHHVKPQASADRHYYTPPLLRRPHTPPQTSAAPTARLCRSHKLVNPFIPGSGYYGTPILVKVIDCTRNRSCCSGNTKNNVAATHPEVNRGSTGDLCEQLSWGFIDLRA